MLTLLTNPIVNLIVGGVVGFIIGRLLEQPFDTVARRIRFRVRHLIARLNGDEILVSQHRLFEIGKWQVPWVLLDGGATSPIKPENVICRYNQAPIQLSPTIKELYDARKASERTESSIEARGFFDGPTAAVSAIKQGHTGLHEETLLLLSLQRSSFFVFLAGVEQYVRQASTTARGGHEFQNIMDLRKPDTDRAGAFAVCMSMISADGFLLLAKRGSEGLFPYGGFLSPAINECLQPELDRDGAGALSVVATARRGAMQETCIDVSESEMFFFSVGIDLNLHSYALTGLIRSTKYTRDELLRRRSQGSKERWESDEWHFIPLEPDRLAEWFEKFGRDMQWSPITFVVFVQTLIHEFGVHTAERIISRSSMPKNFCFYLGSRELAQQLKA